MKATPLFFVFVCYSRNSVPILWQIKFPNMNSEQIWNSEVLLQRQMNQNIHNRILPKCQENQIFISNHKYLSVFWSVKFLFFVISVEIALAMWQISQNQENCKFQVVVKVMYTTNMKPLIVFAKIHHGLMMKFAKSWIRKMSYLNSLSIMEN